MNKFNFQEQFIWMLQDKHRQLLKRQEALHNESRCLSVEIRSFEYNLKEATKLLGKDAKEKLDNIWSLSDDADIYNILAELTTTYKGKEMHIFSEGYLYETIGKDEARAVLGLLNSIYEAAGKPASF